MRLNLLWKRTPRTPSPERFLALRDGTEAAAIELRCLANGTVSGTVILLKDAGRREEDIQQLLSGFDEDSARCGLGPTQLDLHGGDGRGAWEF